MPDTLHKKTIIPVNPSVECPVVSEIPQHQPAAVAIDSSIMLKTLPKKLKRNPGTASLADLATLSKLTFLQDTKQGTQENLLKLLAMLQEAAAQPSTEGRFIKEMTSPPASPRCLCYAHSCSTLQGQKQPLSYEEDTRLSHRLVTNKSS